jgi:transcriptional regulator with XRE-family HTH domain
MSDIQQSLGARLRLKRKELGWSQAKLAENAKTTPGAVQRIENDKSLRIPGKLISRSGAN